jgi:uncharacterized C2H2 Zn-finger protein
LVQETSHQESNQDQISDPISHPDQGDPDNQFECPECGKTFAVEKSLEGHMLRTHRLKPGGKAAKGNLEEETDLNADLKKEAQTTNNMVVLARGKARLKSLDPGAYREHYGPPEQAETSAGKVMADLELSRYIRTLRENESHPNNGDSSQGILDLQRQLSDLRTEMHKKEIEELKSEVRGLREDMRRSTNSGSDLAVCVKSVENLLSEGLSHPGPIRQYLTPTEQLIRDKKDAPALQRVEPSGTVISELARHGLVTQIRKGP